MPIHEFKADLLPKIRELDIGVRKRVLSQTLTGNLVTRFKGSGYEFEGFRNYQPTDDASKIDWKAYLRSNKLMVREYDMERNFFVFIMVDVSNSMLFSSTGKLKCEYAAEMASSLCYSMSDIGAGVGYCLFNDKIIVKQKPELSMNKYYNFVKELRNVNNYGGNYNLSKTIKELLGFLKERTFVIIISDFIGLDENWFRYLQILSQMFQVNAIMIRDPRDRKLPEGIGQYILEDPYTKEKLYIDVNQYSKAYEDYVMEEERLIRRKFELAKSEFLAISTEDDFMDILIKFFRKSAQRWRY